MTITTKKIIRLSIAAMSIIVVAVVSCYIAVSVNANGKTYDMAEDIPYNKVGLLLGTSPITPQGEHNYYFDNRIYATVELYRQGKIKQIIASGGDYSNRENGCNELTAMRDSLMAHGVPDSVITLDYQGTRTLNSIVIAKDIYELDSITIISQKYHNERAIWLAEHYGLNAIAYNAPAPDITGKRIKNTLREFLARVKMLFNLTIGKRPEFELEDSFIHGIEVGATVYREPQPNISHSDIIGIWDYMGRYIRSTLTLKRNGTYSMEIDIDTIWNPYRIYYTKRGNYSYDSTKSTITLLNYHARHELDSTNWTKHKNSRNKELIIVELSEIYVTLIEDGAYVTTYLKHRTFF